jgi:hypothetical protein
VMNKAVDQFVETVEEAAADKLKTLHQIFDQFHDEVKTKFEETFGNWDTFIDTLKDVQKWASIISGMVDVIRLIIQVVSCLAPPALGCLWGLLGQVAIEVLLDIGVPLILNTQDFKEKVIQPALQGLLKDYAGDQIQGVMSSALGKLGLAEFSKDIPECTIAAVPKPSNLLADSMPILQGSALVQHRDRWQIENRSRILADIAPSMRTSGGRTPSESEVNSLINEIQKRNLTSEQLKSLFARNKDSVTGKYNIDGIREQISGGSAPGLGNVPSVSTTAPPPPRSRFTIGPMAPLPGKENDNRSGGAGLGLTF